MQQFQTIKWIGLIVVDRSSNCVMCCVDARRIDFPLSPSDASFIYCSTSVYHFVDGNYSLSFKQLSTLYYTTHVNSS